MRKYFYFYSLLFLIFVTLSGCETKVHNTNTYIVKTDKVFERVRFIGFSDDQISLLRNGLLESACRRLITLQRNTESISEFNCLPGPERNLTEEVSRLLVKYNINKKINYRDGIIEVF